MQNLSDSLFYGEIITISVESYLELLIAGYINISNRLESPFGEKVAVWVSFYCLLMGLAILPVLSIYILTRDKETIKSASFGVKYGAFFDGVKRVSKP